MGNSRTPVAMIADVPIFDRPLPDRPPLTLHQAKAVMQAAESEALAHEWPVAIVLVDAGKGGFPFVPDGKVIGGIAQDQS